MGRGRLSRSARGGPFLASGLSLPISNYEAGCKRGGSLACRLAPVSKPWNPSRSRCARREFRREPVRPSLVIRRDPVRHEKEVQAASKKRQIWGGVAGVLLMTAVALAAHRWAQHGTIFNDASGSAKTVRFGQCLTDYGPNCVVDGETIHVAGEERIAGVDAPEIQGSRCPKRGSAAVQLADLLRAAR